VSNKTKIKTGFTHRGFALIEFTDLYGAECSIQKSSLATDHCIWFGVNEADPKIMASMTPQGGTGWVPYEIPKEVSLNTRMHLSRKQVKQILPILQAFVETGELPHVGDGERE
jgi:hypothetical protein